MNKISVILSLSKDQPLGNYRPWRGEVASSGVFLEGRIVPELILRQAQDDRLFLRNFRPAVARRLMATTGSIEPNLT